VRVPGRRPPLPATRTEHIWRLAEHDPKEGEGDLGGICFCICLCICACAHVHIPVPPWALGQGRGEVGPPPRRPEPMEGWGQCTATDTGGCRGPVPSSRERPQDAHTPSLHRGAVLKCGSSRSRICDCKPIHGCPLSPNYSPLKRCLNADTQCVWGLWNAGFKMHPVAPVGRLPPATSLEPSPRCPTHGRRGGGCALPPDGSVVPQAKPEASVPTGQSLRVPVPNC